MTTAEMLANGEIDKPREARWPDERARWKRHPISRWWILPLVSRIAETVCRTNLRPWHVTAIGFACAVAASGLIAMQAAGWLCAACALVMWGCDRLDGSLARRQGSVTCAGGWLDANLDETADMMIHASIAFAAAAALNSRWPWFALAAFATGKHLFFHGVTSERETVSQNQCTAETTDGSSLVHRVYHGIGAADVRIHVLAVALLLECALAELLLYAAYYNLRWIVRYPLVLRRLSREDVR